VTLENFPVSGLINTQNHDSQFWPRQKLGNFSAQV